MLFAEALILFFGWFVLGVRLWVFRWVGIGTDGFAGFNVDTPWVIRCGGWDYVNVRMTILLRVSVGDWDRLSCGDTKRLRLWIFPRGRIDPR